MPSTQPAPAYAYWIEFVDEMEPRSVGLFLRDISEVDPVFVVMLLHAGGTIRQSLWRYTSKQGWRWLGGDGLKTPNRS